MLKKRVWIQVQFESLYMHVFLSFLNFTINLYNNWIFNIKVANGKGYDEEVVVDRLKEAAVNGGTRGIRNLPDALTLGHAPQARCPI